MDFHHEQHFTMTSYIHTCLLLQLAVIFCSQTLTVIAEFGDAFEFGRDETFEKMGEAKIAEFTVTNDDGFCTEKWNKFGSTCYFFAHSALVNYTEAVTECTDKDSTLVRVDNQDIQDFLAAELSAGMAYMIGLNDIYEEGNFTWQNRQPGSFTAWNNGLANNLDEEDCVSMVYDAQGQWIGHPCSELRAYICQRPSVAGHVHLHIAFENAYQVDEIWLFDFQPFDFNNTTPIVTTGQGSLDSTRTGTCSNIFTDTTYDPVEGFYKDSFLPAPPGDKDLFQFYVRGDTYERKGKAQLRTDLLTFDGDMESLFDCKNSLGENVWERDVHNDNFEFRTTLYMTNIRPKHTTADGSIAPPTYMQSYITLYWRLLRYAVSRFLVSSVERLRPIFEYAIVRPVYLNDNPDYGIDLSRAEVEISFWTITDTRSRDGLLSVYKPAPVSYTSNDLNANVNSDHGDGLVYVKDTPDLGCEDALGMQNRTIPDSQIAVSSTLEDLDIYDGRFARLNAQPIEGVSAGAWFAALEDPAPFIEITLQAVTTVSGIVTQGQWSHSGDLWVTSYYVQYEVYALSTLVYVTDDDGNNKEFSANFDRDTAVTNYFITPVRTKLVRIEPNNTSEGFVAMRLEIIGCEDELPVRLVGGSGPHEGRVEIYHDGSWGTICNNQWSTNSATVVCRQLGYGYAEYHDAALRFYGEGSNPVVLDIVMCDGREATLASCQYSHFGVNSCLHSNDVGVLCTQDEPVNTPSVRLVDGVGEWEGRVEIWHNDEWGTICNRGWSMVDAHVVCRELGYADALEVVSSERFGPGPSDFKIWLNNVNCLGGESSLSQCTHADWNVNSCVHDDDVGVVCAGDSPKQTVGNLAVLYAPSCNYSFWPNSCTQHWQFTAVIDIDISNTEEGMPTDMTGEFVFCYYLYDCPDMNADVGATRDTCQKVDVPHALISHKVSLQTTIEVADEKTDKPLIEVVRIYGTDPSRDLRYEEQGVSHGERVTIETKFYPEYLRQLLELELSLFMVCIGEEYQSMPDGCLAAPASHRYSAFISPGFVYTMLVDQTDPDGSTTDLTADDLHSSQQDLESYQYVADEDLHRSTFINTALSGESRIYTMTIIFQLVDKGTGLRRVVRRDIMDNAATPVGVKHAFVFTGCPGNSTYNGQRECVCDEGLVYSTGSFECVPIYIDNSSNKVPEGTDSDGVEVNDEDIDNVIGVMVLEEEEKEEEEEDVVGFNGSSVLQTSRMGAFVSTLTSITIMSLCLG